MRRILAFEPRRIRTAIIRAAAITPAAIGRSYQHNGYGYGYYTPGVVVTTIITSGAPIVTETVETSTRTYYENVPVRKRYVAKKKWKPRAKPRCVC
jgi:hypothetical protein